MSQPALRSICTTDLVEILNWCREYNQFNRYPVSPRGRFSIAFYQIYQGMHWEQQGPVNANANEGFASACVHLLLTAEQLNLYPEVVAGNLLSIETKLIDYRSLLFHLSRAQQMIWYAAGVNNVKRKSRYNPRQLLFDITDSIKELMGCIPTYLRSTAIEHATDIMTGKL